MKYLTLSLFLFLCLSANAQIERQYLINTWSKVHTVMLDGSKYNYGDSNEIYQWQITDSHLLLINKPEIVLSSFSNRILYNNPEGGQTNFSISYSGYKGVPYKLENNYLKLSPQMEYKIEKLTKDTLIVTEYLSQVKDKDKIRIFLFLDATSVTNHYKNKFKNESILIANEHYTPQLNSESFLKRINKYSATFRRSDLEITGKFILYPKLKKVNFEVKHLENYKKYKDGFTNLITQIEQSFSDWDIIGFENFEQIEISTAILMNPSGRALNIIFFPENNWTNEKMEKKMKRLDLSKLNYNKALTAFEQKNYEKAILAFEKSYELNFENIDALYSIATCYSLLGDDENTCKTLQKLKDLGQTDGTLLYNKKCKAL